MNRLQLDYFLAVCQHGNLSRAAAASHVVASAVSYQIGLLEDELGVALFERSVKGMAPTAAGIRLQEHARDILRRFELASTDVRGLSSEVHGEVAIAIAHTVVEGIGLPLMQRVTRDYPRLRLALSESMSRIALESVASGEADIGLVYNPQASARVLAEPLLREAIYCVGTPAIIGKSRRAIRFASVEKLPQGVSSRSITEREDLQRRLRASAVLELNSITAMRKALAAGLCCSALPLTTVRDLLDAGVIRARRIVEPEVTRDLYLVTQRERSPTAAFETIRALIRALVREEVKAGRWPATLLANPARRARRLPAAATPATAPAAGRPAAARAAR
ncbi:MAG: LysR family transcriptional regulator [Burkholderiaceae bacterium]|nr:LysR family transcriptional regulator [Burkholderiaceae bacterium]